MGTPVKQPRAERRVVGWREWVALPDIGVKAVKAKVDTGARTSCLHAFDVEVIKRRGKSFVRFSVHPLQDDATQTVRTELPLLEQRWVKSSNGKREYRPVVETPLSVGDETWTIQLTLTSRDLMGFRMLLGREALRRRVVVDPGRSFLLFHEERDRAKVAKKKPKMRIRHDDA